MAPPVEPSLRSARVGVAYGLGAYLFWGLVPVYFKAVASIPPLEILAHRVVWSLVLLAALLTLRRSWKLVFGAVASRTVAVTLAATTLLIAVNWYVFIWAVGRGHILQASLGYYINPLVNVVLGYVFLGERLDRWQKTSVALAAAGVAYLTFGYGQVPWIALTLAGSFGFYGLLRKTVPIGALAGLTVETVMLGPLALGYIVYLAAQGAGSFGTVSRTTDGLLILAGVVTAVPLLWFANAARRLRLATLGFLQYLAPTGHFLLAVIVFDEPFNRDYLITFVCIWTALLIYSVDTARGRTVSQK
ncbi:MAG: EamA family transporter RarD [bacterium]|nr:EamA family transporter RarD [bacterium]